MATLLHTQRNNLTQTTTGTPTGEHHPSSPGHPPETLHTRYLLPIRDFH